MRERERGTGRERGGGLGDGEEMRERVAKKLSTRILSFSGASVTGVPSNSGRSRGVHLSPAFAPPAAQAVVKATKKQHVKKSILTIALRVFIFLLHAPVLSIFIV